MAGALRLTKAEREFLQLAIDTFDCTPKQERLRDSINKKVELAELPVKKGSYLTVNDAIAAFRGVLGPRLVAPPFSAIGVLSQMKKRIQALGLTRADCVTIAKVAGAEWQGAIRAESLVRQADKLLAGAQTGIEYSTPQTNKTSPVELGDEDI